MATTLTTLVGVVFTAGPVTQTVKVESVTTTSKCIGYVPPGHAYIIQNLGAKQVTLSNTTPAVKKKGFILKGGTPGGMITPGGARVGPAGQWWYAITTTGTTTIAFMVI